MATPWLDICQFGRCLLSPEPRKTRGAFVCCTVCSRQCSMPHWVLESASTAACASEMHNRVQTTQGPFTTTTVKVTCALQGCTKAWTEPAVCTLALASASVLIVVMVEFLSALTACGAMVSCLGCLCFGSFTGQVELGRSLAVQHTAFASSLQYLVYLYYAGTSYSPLNRERNAQFHAMCQSKRRNTITLLLASHHVHVAVSLWSWWAIPSNEAKHCITWLCLMAYGALILLALCEHLQQQSKASTVLRQVLRLYIWLDFWLLYIHNFIAHALSGWFAPHAVAGCVLYTLAAYLALELKRTSRLVGHSSKLV